MPLDKGIELIRQCSTDELVCNAGYSDEDVWLLDTYDVFARMHKSIESVLTRRKDAKVSNDFHAFRLADNELWQHGHALLALGIAQKYGWVDEHLLLTARR